ncbi:MAG: ABC transporter permease [Actinomycetota bacterium]|nr:ABC transporter permease [Actinomycetota bacterium]
MLSYIVRRVLISIPILIVSSVLVFTFMRLTTDPTRALINPRMSQEDVARVKAALGLDKSGPEQYVAWLSHFARGDWGISLQYERPVKPILIERFVNTLKLMAMAVILSLFFAIAVGVYSAVRPYSKLDYTFTGASFFGISMPIFWFGLILQLVMGFYLERWLGSLRHTFHFLPAFLESEPLFFTGGLRRPGTIGFSLGDFLRHATLPSLALMVQLVAGWGRYERASMLEVMGSDYMRTARAKGVSETKVVLKHGLRNALIPLVTVVAIDVGGLFGGLIITESIFSWPGMGGIFVDSLLSGDHPIVLSWLMVTAGLIVAFNLLADILYASLDPRIRYD